MNWKVDKAWSDRFISEIKAILGTALIAEAELDEDQLENTDLITLRLPGLLRIACRVRRFEYLAEYGDEFTLRSRRPGGTATELDKLLSGWGDYLFYGFADTDELRLVHWFIGDLAVFRRWADDYWDRFREVPGELRQNCDGSSMFRVFNVDEVVGDFVLAKTNRKGAA